MLILAMIAALIVVATIARVRAQRRHVHATLPAATSRAPKVPSIPTSSALGSANRRSTLPLGASAPVGNSQSVGWKRARPTPEQVIRDRPWDQEARNNGTAWIQPPSYARSAAARRRFAARGREMKREYERKRDQRGKPPVNAAFSYADGGCWEWRGLISELGYGYVYGQPAHRLMYRHYKADIPSGYVLMHTCDNRKCVNPDHLVPGTQQENMADMHAKGRARPFGQPQKLRPLQRQEIAARYQEGETAASLADEFGISAGYVQRVSGPRRSDPDRRWSGSTEERDQIVARRYHDGESGAALADEFGISPGRVSQIHSKYYQDCGPRKRAASPSPVATYDAAVAAKLRREGWTHQSIADELGCSKSTVGRLLERHEKPNRE